MPEGTEGTETSQDGAEGQQNQQDGQSGSQGGETPPWDREGQQFDPERAWGLIQTLRGERDTLRTERDQLSGQVSEFQQQSMSEQERAVAAARDEGRQAAVVELGQQLARVQFDALAARRNPDFDTAQALEFVDLGRFIGQDGSIDQQAVQAAVERLVPAASTAPPSFDGGGRDTASGGGDMNALIRAGLGRR